MKIDHYFKREETDPLVCPRCGFDYLHQREVRAIWGKEDQDPDMYTSSIDGYGVRSVKRRDVVGRRDCIEIEFECENCDMKPELLIVQHKGQTIIGWSNK